MSEPKEKKTGAAPEKKPTRPATKAGAGRRVAPRQEPKPGRPADSAPFAAEEPGKKPTPRRTTGASQVKRKEAPLTKQQQVLRGLYIALVAISAVIVAVYLFWSIFAAAPDPEKHRPGVEEVTRPPMTTQIVDEKTGQLVEVEIPGLSADRKKEFYTFLLVGQSQDTGGKLSDTMMLVAYDVPNQALNVMSLPRDTYVLYNGRLMLLNAVYNAAGGDKDNKGIQGLKRAVRDLTGIYPDYHVIVQWEALGELVDAIGGVYYDVPFDMYYNDLSQHFKINLKKGYQLLDGEGAMGLVRWRHNSDDKGHISHTYGYAEGDIGRIKTQQAFLKEVIKQCLQMDKLLTNLGDYVSIFQKNVITDLSVGNIAYFAQSALTGLDMDKVKFETLPWYSAGNAHILPTGSQIVKVVNDGFNPYENDIRLGELKLATMDNVPRASAAPDPEESLDPEETPDPDTSSSPGPGASPQPSESEDVILPPGSFSRPTASPNPSRGPNPTASSRPTGSVTPEPGNTETPAPADTAEPTSAPTAQPSPPPAPTPEPPADTPAPIFTPPPMEEEPLLPPM